MAKPTQKNKIVFSNRFKSLLESMPENTIQKILFDLIESDEEYSINQNFFDLAESNDTISFVQNRKAQEILNSEITKYKVCFVNGMSYLTFNKRDGEYINKIIFDDLNLDVESERLSRPQNGQIGIILKETPSRKVENKMYVLFETIHGKSVFNKLALEPYDDREQEVWKLNKNPIKVGRAIKSILKATNKTTPDTEVEKFVNIFKSSIDVMNDSFSKFDIVDGKDISKWYHIDKYENHNSTLGDSCMANVNKKFFDIYVENPEVCKLVILYSDDGKIKDGKYKSKTIKGRALLWKTDCGTMFLDRIYYNYDSDVELFKQFAKKNNWVYKERQDSEPEFDAIINGDYISPKFTITLKKYDFNSYPYLDTMSYLNNETGILSNDDEADVNLELKCTDGNYCTLDD